MEKLANKKKKMSCLLRREVLKDYLLSKRRAICCRYLHNYVPFVVKTALLLRSLAKKSSLLSMLRRNVPEGYALSKRRAICCRYLHNYVPFVVKTALLLRSLAKKSSLLSMLRREVLSRRGPIYFKQIHEHTFLVKIFSSLITFNF